MEVYLDYAATSYRKPEEVFLAMNDFLHNHNANPGRGGYERSLQASRMILEARDTIGHFFGSEKSEYVVFTLNVTMALNMAILGLVSEGDHILISSLEHNAVYRPLYALAQEEKITYDVIPCFDDGTTDPDVFLKCLRNNTKMVVLSHASNVFGTIFPLRDIAHLAKERGIMVVVDAAQTAGVLPLSMDNIDVLAFTGHKHLLGPTGTGGFVLSKEAVLRMRPVLRGGTGSLSHQAEQPIFMPDKFESGTLNTMGIMGLKAGIEFIERVTQKSIRSKEKQLTERLLQGLSSIKKVRIYGPKTSKDRVGTVAFNMDGVDNGELCYVLDKQYHIMGRPGLHCSPLAHQALGTFPEGAIRFSLGYYSTMEEIDYTLTSLANIVKKLQV